MLPTRGVHNCKKNMREILERSIKLKEIQQQQHFNVEEIRHSHFRERPVLIELDLQCNTFSPSIS